MGKWAAEAGRRVGGKYTVAFQGAGVLIAKEIRKRYGEKDAVRGISLELKPGECLALLGPNGAGKTTTCEMLEGLIRPDSGSISVFGMDYDRHRKSILKRTGVQLQETTLYKKYTVWETLRLFASFYSDPVDVTTLIESLQLSDKVNSRLEHLSGGQKQRVYLGCSLINDPELLFLDEPSSGLDPQARRYLWDLLKQFRSESRSILLTTHYMEEAAGLADRIAIMDHGQIIAVGSLGELIRQHCPDESLCFSVDERSFLELKKSLSWLQQAKRCGQKTKAKVHDAPQKTQELLRAADQAGIIPGSFTIRQPTLEDVFLKLTGRRLRDD